MISEVVPDAFDGDRLDRYVSLLVGCSRSRSARLVADGNVSVNDTIETTRSRAVAAGDVVTITGEVDAPILRPAPDDSVELAIVHADDDLVVVDKPPGLVVHPGSGNPTGTLVNGLLARFPEIADVGEPHRPGIVHRLDVGTSGLMMVARSAFAYDALVAALAARRVKRRYLAVVWGEVEADEGLIDSPMARSPRDPLKMALVADGKQARTRYLVERRVAEPGVSVVHCELETGRTHQIRVHLAAIGHPVVGDLRYGNERESLLFRRPALHAEHLRLNHPVSAKDIEFDAEPPADLRELLAQLG